MKHIFCLDTNVLRNEKGESWIKENEINKLLPYGMIVIPEIVLEEIEQKAIRGFEKEKSSLGSKLKSFFSQQIEEIDIKQKVKENIDFILSKEGVEKIKLTDFSVLPKMKELAILKQPPFEEGDNTDKGFKDCYIYFTVLEYIKKNSDVELFFRTKDKRLKATYQGSSISTIEGLEDYLNNFSLSDYQKEKIAGILNVDVRDISVGQIEKNINDNQLVSIKIRNDDITIYYRFEIDAGEIVHYILENDVIQNPFEDTLLSIEDVIDRFVISGSFYNTHRCIFLLTRLQQYLFNEEVVKIFEAIANNEQIYWILGDDDVGIFIKNLLEKKGNILNNETKNTIENHIKNCSSNNDDIDLPF